MDAGRQRSLVRPLPGHLPEGIALAPDWVIHSSGQGVYVLPLGESYLGDEFSWGRRLL